MPRFPGFPERPQYNSVKAYLSELAMDIAEMVVDPSKMERFREQSRIYAELWKQWITFDEANRKNCWTPSIGRPEYIFNIFSRSYNPLNKPEEEDKRLAGSYALCALIHDTQLPHLEKINKDIIPEDAVEGTLSAPRNTLEHRIVGNWNSGPDVGEIYLIEEFFNRVTVDLQEFCKSEENKLTQESIERQIQQANQLSDEEFLELTAKKFEERAKIILSKDETWHDLNRSFKGWFDAAIERLKKLNLSEGEIGLLNYFYKNLLHYAQNINIKSFRGFRDSPIVGFARKQATELAEKVKDLAQKAKSSQEEKTEIPVISKGQEPAGNESDDIVELLRKDYQLKNENNLKQEIAIVVQECIEHGSYNSTNCTGKQLQARYVYIEELIDYIIETLQQDFTGMPLANFKEKLLALVDEEYKKLIPFANIHLVNAALVSKSTLKCIEQQVGNKREKTKQAIETRFAILEKKKATPTLQSNSIFGETWTIGGIPINIKKLYTKLKSHPIWLILCFLAIVLFATRSLWWPLINSKIVPDSSENINIDTGPKASGNSSPAIIQSGPNSTITVNYDSPESKTKQIAENKLDSSLRNICRDIDSRPLAQQSDTAKQYVGIRIQEERLKLLDIDKHPERDIYFLSMAFPDQSDTSYSTGRRILCDIPKEQHPELNLAKQGVELYISGQIKEAGAKYIKLSDVSLRFE